MQNTIGIQRQTLELPGLRTSVRQLGLQHGPVLGARQAGLQLQPLIAALPLLHSQALIGRSPAQQGVQANQLRSLHLPIRVPGLRKLLQASLLR